MSQAHGGHGVLFSLYERYIGEPKSKKQVYGYWLFILGCLVGFAGVLLFVATTRPGEVSFQARLSYTLAGMGLPIALFGIVLLLPVRERAIHAALAGVGITILGLGGFNVAYPSNWAGFGADYTTAVVSVYTTGLAIIAGVVVLVPILTGREGMLVEDEVQGLDAHPPVMVGQQNRGTLFSVFRRPGEHWTWRAVQQNAIAGSAAAADSRTEAKDAVETVKTKVREARLLEITTAAFRLYEDQQGVWRWVLMRDDGSVVAESADRFDSRQATESSVTFTKDEGRKASILEIDGVAFDCYRDGDYWRWRLLDDDRTVLAESPTAYETETDAEQAVDTMSERVDGARVLAIDPIAVELFEVDGGYRWKLLDADDQTIAVSAIAFEARRNAEADAEGILDALPDATVVERGEPGVEIYESDGEWRWRLLDDHDEVVAISAPDATDREVVRDAAARVTQTVDDAEVFEIENADYEIYPEDDEWHWRFVTEDRQVIADHTAGYENPNEATMAIKRIHEQAQEAELLEFETAAFQQYQTDDGDWRWRLIDEGGTVLADSGQAYDSKDDAGSAMATLKAKAPDADLLEIETTAFELFTDEDDRWGWRLIDDGGHLVAEGAERHESKQGARDAMDYLIEYSPSADVRTVQGTDVQLYTEDDEWRWRCVHQDGSVLAVSPGGHPTRDDVVAAVEDLKGPATGASIHVIEELAFEVDPDDGRRWDLIDYRRDVLAEGRQTYDDAAAARDAVETLRRNADDATIFEIEDAAIKLTQGDDGWRWELIDRDRSVYAQSAGGYGVRASAATVIDEVRSQAPAAGLLEFETAGFEIYEDDGQWRWQLLNADEDVVATSAVGYETEDEARAAVVDIRELLESASVLEIDDPTFEVHQQEGGWIWRLVDENGNSLAESVETYDTRSAARERMNTLKEYAPDGALSVAG